MYVGVKANLLVAKVMEIDIHGCLREVGIKPKSPL
jgi:hypothetical protein